jgi:signal transduction histidine kinase
MDETVNRVLRQPPSAETGPGARDLLLEAAEEARARWRRRHPDTVPEAVLEDSADLLLAALLAPRGSPIPEEARADEGLLEVRLRLLEFVRHAFVQGAGAAWSDEDGGPDAGRFLAILLRFEELAGVLEPRGEAQLTAGLGGPRAGELLVEIGHDLRSPLTSVLFLAEVLSASPGIRDDRHQLRQLGLIHAAAVTMLTLVNNFIELARTPEQSDEPEPSVFSLADLLEGLRRTLRPLADEKELAFRVSNRVPGSDRRCGYPVALSRILLNLGSNAIRYTDQGSVAIEVHEPAPGLVTLEVVDTGRGMDPERVRSLEDVFEPSATGSGVHFSGSGLGLVIVRKLLRRLGSELHLASKRGKGTRASFTVPLRTAG